MHVGVRCRGRWLAGLAALGVLALVAPAAAHADDTWSGGSSSSHWSQAGNWASGVLPGASSGTLTFPDLGACGAPAACYLSDNDVAGVSASGLVFGNVTTGSGYDIVGNGLSVGAGGITDVGGHSTTATLNTPLTLRAAQTWTIGSRENGYNDLSLAPPAAVRGSFALGVAFPSETYGDLFVDSDMEVGPVTVTGSGGFHIGAPTSPGSVNGSDGQPVLLHSAVTLVANPGATAGPLTLSGASLLLGTGPSNNKTTTLRVNGAASLASARTTTTYLNDNGATAGVDYSQLSASGDVSLGGVLSLNQAASGATCVALSRGDVATLVATTGTLSGSFSNAPNGAIIPMASSCPSPATVHIAYTANQVTATVISGTTPTATTLADPSPSPAATNQPVTLSATVATLTDSLIAPSGTVAFFANGHPLAGCTSQGLSGSGSSATATCRVAFGAASSHAALTATFTAAPTSGQASSSSAGRSLTVNRASTATSLTTRDRRPAIGTRVTYTATVTPARVGASTPSGRVRFLDAGRSITGCAAQTLTTRSSSFTATCTVTYSSAHSHPIVARYGGDTNFGSSTSSTLTVSVQAMSPTPPRSEASRISATTAPATQIGTTRATLLGKITTGGATVTWRFEYGSGKRYDKATPRQTIAAGGQRPVSVSRTVTRLSANVRYRFRLVVATRAPGSATIPKVRTFTTHATGRLLSPAARLTVTGHTILVPETCRSRVRCTGRVSITTTTPPRTKHATALRCTSRLFVVKAHRHARVRAPITSACLARLETDRHRRIAAKLTARLRTGQRGLTKTITLALRR